jgi:catechol 2,3-dioxygenase-like lactoylglutathione lyase family enzyme
MLTTINHIALAVQDLESATKRYRALFGREPERDGDASVRFQLDNVALVIAATDDSRQPEGIRKIGFATPDRAKARHNLERRGIGIDADDPQTLELATSATHGVRIEIVEASFASTASPTICHISAAITGLDHIVITTSHPERAAALYGARLGLDMKLDRTHPDWGSRLMFFKCGDAIVEVAHSLKNADPNSLDKAWGLSWRANDIDAANVRLAQAGFNVSEVRAGRKPGTRVFTVRDAPAGMPTLIIGPARSH